MILKEESTMFKHDLKIVLTLAQKNFILYIKKGSVLIFGLLFPFFMLISWILGRSISPDQIIIGIISMTSFFTATAVSPVILPIETREKSLERLFAAPVSLMQILLGIILASALYSFGISSIITLIFLLIYRILALSFISVLAIYLGIFLMALLGSLIGLLISAKPSDQTSDIMVIINLIKFPLLFLGGVFIPLSNLSTYGSILNLVSPLTYLTELLRGVVNKSSIIPPGFNILILCIWIALLSIINYYIHKRTMPKRFSEVSNSKNMMKKVKLK
ncbi:MAG: ABC transporter permease [Promethearchaeota archaeon]|nr:MAG: ABC transporter permease [Candidatus Lokiarchaeota archaeon]